MHFTVEQGVLMSAWQDSFDKTDADTGKTETITYYRGLLTVAGQAPMQLPIHKDDFEKVQELSGTIGDFDIELLAQPGRGIKVYLRGLA